MTDRTTNYLEWIGETAANVMYDIYEEQTLCGGCEFRYPETERDPAGSDICGGVPPNPPETVYGCRKYDNNDTYGCPQVIRLLKVVLEQYQ